VKIHLQLFLEKETKKQNITSLAEVTIIFMITTVITEINAISITKNKTAVTQ